MKRFFKYTLIAFLVLILILAGLFWYAYQNTDKILAFVQKNIEENVSSVLGTTVSMHSVTAGSFPDTSIQIKGLKIDSTPTIPGISAGSLELRLGLMDLLSSKVNVKEIKLSDYEILLADNKKTGSAHKEQAVQDHDSGNHSKITVDIQKVEFYNGKLKYSYGELVKSALIERLSVRLSGLHGGFKSISVSDIEAQVNINEIPGENQKVSIKKIFAANDEIVLDGGTFNSTAVNFNFNADYNTKKSNLQAELHVSELKFSEINKFISFPGLTFSNGQGEIFLKINGDTEEQKLSASADLKSLSGRYNQNKFQNMNGKLNCLYNSDTLTLNVLHLQTEINGISSPLRLSGDASYHINNNKFSALNLKAEINSAKISEVAAFLPVPAGHEKGTMTLTSDFKLTTEGKISNSTTLVAEHTDFSPEGITATFNLLIPDLDGQVRISAINAQLSKIAPLVPALSVYNVSTGYITGSANFLIKNKNLLPESATFTINNYTSEISGIPLEDFSFHTTLTTLDSSRLFQLESIKGNIKTLPVDGSLKVMLEDALRLRDIRLTLGNSLIIGGARFEQTNSNASIFGGKIEGGALGTLASTFTGMETGALQGTLVRAEGEFRSNDITKGAPSVYGKSYVSISDAVFKGVNIGKIVIEKLEEIPLIGRDLTKDLPPELRESLTARDTNFQTLISSLAVESENYSLSDILVKSDIFNATGSGEVSADKNLNIRLNVVLTPQISEFIAIRVREMNLLVNSRGELEVPVIIRGSISAPSVIPDTSALLAKAAQRTAQDAIGNLIRQGLENRDKNRLYK